MGVLLWCVTIASVFINVVVLAPKKWRLLFWGLLPLGIPGGFLKVFEEPTTLTAAQKRKQTLDAKKLEDKVKLEGMILLKVISNNISVEHPTVSHASIIHMVRHQLDMSSSNLKSFLGLDNPVPTTTTPVKTSDSPRPTSRPTTEERPTPVHRVPSPAAAGGGRSKSPRRGAEEKKPSGGMMQALMASPLLAALRENRSKMGYDEDE